MAGEKVIRRAIEAARKAVAPEDLLMGIHNTAEGRKLDMIERLGGLPAPSIAITKPSQGYTYFGDISLVAPVEMVTPGRKTPVFGSDVYSPRFPSVEDDQIFRGFTPAGNRRYAPLTMENVLREMKGNVRGGENFNYGPASIRAQVTPQFGSLPEMQAAREKIIPSSEFGAQKDMSTEMMERLRERFEPYFKPTDPYRRSWSAFPEVLTDYARTGRPSEFAYDYKDLPAEALTDARSFLSHIRDMPTEYFEAKPQRAVPLSEFSGAVVPADVPGSVVDRIRNMGINRIEEYGDDASRAAALMKFVGEQGFADGGAVDFNDAPNYALDNDAAFFDMSRVFPPAPGQKLTNRAENIPLTRSFGPAQPEVVDRALDVVRSEPRPMDIRVSRQAPPPPRPVPRPAPVRASAAPDTSESRRLWEIYNETGSPADFVRASNAMRAGRAEGGEVRDGYAGGGKPIKSVIDQALAAIRKARPEQMRRAREQGFDTTKMYLHGTQTSPEVINPNFYVSRDPEIADIYARRGEHLLPEGQNPEGSAVMPVLVKKGSAVPGRPLTGYFSVLNPSDVRSVFAEFDPAKKDSGNIMSSIAAPVALGAGYMAEGEREERASGGRLLEDQYPTQYLPNVGRQVMADGGSPAAEKYEAMPGFFSRMLGLSGGSQPEADIQQYENRMRAIAQQPADIQSMTHAPSKPMRPIEIEGGFIGKRQLGEAPYDVAGPLSGMAQTAYSLKTVPFYFTPAAPFAAAADLGEAAIDTKSALDKGDYLGAGVTGALGVVAPALAYRRQAGDAVRSGLEAARRFVTSNPGTATAVGAGAATLAPEEAEASKSRMVQQVMDIVRGITPPPSNKDPRFWHNISSTKLSRPIDEMRAGYEKVGTDLQPLVRQPSDYEGKAFVTALGDPSIGGVRLLSVNERNLTNPTLMQAGPSFVHGASAQGPDRAIWASDLPLVSALANRAAAAQKAGYEPYLNYVKMGGESPDYSHHITDPLIDLFRQSKVDKGTVADFDKKMREGFSKDFPAYADWPGLRSKNLESYLFGTGPGKARTAMAKLMATGDFQKRGMPDVAAVRFAATEPDLLNAPNYSSGRMIARMDPNAVAIRNPEVPHRTYRAQLAAHPEGADPARFSDNIPLEIAHRDWVEKVRQDMPKISSSNLQFKFQRQSPTLYMTPETVDRMSTFLDLKKRGLIP